VAGLHELEATAHPAPLGRGEPAQGPWNSNGGLTPLYLSGV